VPKSTVGGFGDRFLVVLDGELRLRLEAEEHRREVGRELAHEGVVLLRRLDEALARDRDAVLVPSSWRLQLAEVLVGLELRIVLDHREQAARAPPVTSRCAWTNCWKACGLSTISGVAWIEVALGARLGDADQHLLLCCA